MLLTVRFAEQGAKTKLTLHQAAFETVTSRDGHQDEQPGSSRRIPGKVRIARPTP